MIATIIFSVLGILTTAAACIFAALFFRRIVPTNMVHIVQSAKQTTAYGKDKPAGNSYFEWPAFLPFIGVSVTTFPESIFQVTLKDYPAYDAARLPFEVDVAAFFKVQDAAMVAQRVASFVELNSQLLQVLQGAVRRILATNTLEDIMEARASLGKQFTDEVSADIKEWGVLPVKNIEFMDLRDTKESKVILNIMSKEQSRIDMESRIRVAENHKLAELTEIDAKRTVEVQKQDAMEQVGIRTAEKDKAVGIASEVSAQEIKEQQRLTTEKDMAVLQVETLRQAQITKDAAEIKAEQDKNVAAVKADQDKTVAVKAAEANKDALILVADGQLAEAKNVAEGTRLKGLAEADAQKAMLQAPVDTQISLAKEIGENEGYQQYLVAIKNVDASREVGVELAKAMQGADLKVIANSGDIQSGVASIGDMFTTGGGTKLSGMLAALAQTDQGKEMLNSLNKRIKGDA